ncbi:hypothetical protein JCM3765_005489 [Sporobolomyces pararoseus]
MSMQPARTHVCSVCDKPTTQACANCKGMYFCSQRCQKLIWPTHRFLCGKDRSTFLFPPLSKEERADMELLEGRRFDHTCERCISPPQTKVEGASLLEHAQSLGLFDGDWSSLLDSITVGDKLIEEPRLSTLLVLVRAQLDESRTTLNRIRPVRSNILSELAFNGTARSFSPLISCRDAKDHFATLDSDPLRKFSRLLHQLIIVVSMLTTMRTRGINLIPELRISARRLLDLKEPLLRTSLDPVTANEALQLFKQWEAFPKFPDIPIGRLKQAMKAMEPSEE